MNRNQNVYGDKILAPRSRSLRKIDTGGWTTFKSGVIVPLKTFHVLAGDTFKPDFSYEMRMLTPAVPTMSNATINFGWFFVPNRITAIGTIANFSRTNDWETMFGEVKEGYWANQSETTLKKVPLWSCNAQSPANYLGCPIEKDIAGTEVEINLLEEMAFCQIWNDHFRNPNLQAPIDLEVVSDLMKSDGIDINNETENDGSSSAIAENWALEKGMDNFPVCKNNDYFTTALREPQRGEPVTIGLGGTAPVVCDDPKNIHTNGHSLKFVSPSGTELPTDGTDYYLGLQDQTNKLQSIGVQGGQQLISNEAVPGNLIADLTKINPLSINELRQLFAIQGLKERSARNGSRYYQYLLSAFGTAPNDSVLQRSEYLGGMSAPVNITQVLATNGTTEQPLGSTGAFSNSSNFQKGTFEKSFTEPGVIMLLAWVKTDQIYGQGINCMKTKFRQYDFYDPMFANLGEQPIYNKELYINQVHTEMNNQIFGYKQAWQEYRVDPDTVSGLFSPDSEDKTLIKWTYANKFTDTPTLNADFIKQSDTNIGDTLTVTDTKSQFLINIHIGGIKASTVPSMSIPALLGGM